MSSSLAPITVIIHTRNAEKTLSQAIDSVNSWVKKVIVVDMESEDETVAIAKAHDLEVVSISPKKYKGVDAARNYGYTLAKDPWVLSLDSDEVISPALSEYIKDLIQKSEGYSAFAIPRKNLIWGAPVVKAGWWPDYQIRLFRNGQVDYPAGVHQQPKVKGKVKYLPEDEALAIIHYNYDTIEDYLLRFNGYTSLEFDQISKVKSPIEAFDSEFGRRLFGLTGVEAGQRGVGLSLLQGMYQLVAQLKYLEKKEQLGAYPYSTKKVITELKSFRSNLAFWYAHYQQQHSPSFLKPYWWLRKKLKV